jgi:hypothetical protein
MQIVSSKENKIQFVYSNKKQLNKFQQIVSLAIEQVRVKLQTKASARFHISVNSFKSALLQSSVLKA